MKLSRRSLSVLVAHSEESEGQGDCHGDFCLFLVRTPRNQKGKEIVTANSVCSCCALRGIRRVRKLSRRILSVLVAHSEE